VAGLTWITSGYGWLAIVVPVIAAAPGYFSGSLSLGGLMMVVGAFNQVQQALRWFIDNFSRIADWRATLQRILAFRSALSTLEGKRGGAERIAVTAHPAGNLAFEHLSVSLPEGRAVLEEHTVEVRPGERVLLVGEPRAGKSTAFLAMAGLWPWGTGTVRLPARASMSFMPQRPYLPLGTLRVAVCYPADPGQFSDAAVHAVLARVGLGRFVALLDRKQRWDKDLELGEQQCLAFARLLLHKPRWVLIDDAMSALDDERRRTMLSIFERELAGAALIITGRSPAHNGFYTRTLRLLHLAGDSQVRVHPRSVGTPIPRQI
jgi:putative ATP-binding cassette transporter